MPSGTTYFGTNNPLTVKAYSAALFSQLVRANTFRNKLRGPAPTEAEAARMAREPMITSSGNPFVEINDLSKGPGDEVTYGIVDVVTGKPVIGDRRLSGKLMSLKFADQKLRINQFRAGVDSGGKMTQKRSRYNLRKQAMAQLYGWNNRFLDQLSLVHLAGARGRQNSRDWVIPLSTDPDFSEIVVNALAPPTFNRRYVVGSGVGGISSAIDTADVLDLEAIDALRVQIEESEFPMQGIRLEGDMSVDDENPMYVMYVSPYGYKQLRDTSTDKDWNTLLSSAVSRGSVSKHPLFGVGDLMWSNILIKKSARNIRFQVGDSVSEYTNATTIGTGTAGADFDRAIVLGAQALACAWGQDGSSGMPLTWFEEETDKGNRFEVSTSFIGGWRKLTFTLDSVPIDHGVWVVDYHNGLVSGV